MTTKPSGTQESNILEAEKRKAPPFHPSFLCSPFPKLGYSLWRERRNLGRVGWGWVDCLTCLCAVRNHITISCDPKTFLISSSFRHLAAGGMKESVHSDFWVFGSERESMVKTQRSGPELYSSTRVLCWSLNSNWKILNLKWSKIQNVWGQLQDAKSGKFFTYLYVMGHPKDM